MSILSIETWKHDLPSSSALAALHYHTEHPAQRYLQALEQFHAAFGHTQAAVFSAPGRTELSGNHTDHQLGRVLTGSVTLDMIGIALPRADQTVRVLSEGYPQFEIVLNELAPREKEKEHTAGIIRGVAAGLADLGYQIGGADIYITSNVPKGGGLSSSAALEILLGTIFNHLYCDGKVDDITLARIGQRAENVYFGKPSGLLDQMGCALGGITAMDFSKDDLALVQLQPDFAAAGYQLFVVNAGGSHAGLTDEYAAIPNEMRAVAQHFGADVLAQVEEAAFYAAIPVLRKSVGDRAIIRAMHFFEENQRVLEQVNALQENDYERYRTLMLASGKSSYELLQNIYPSGDIHERSLSLALGLAEHILGARGAWRVHGGGFAGTIQAMVPTDLVPEFLSQMRHFFGETAVDPIVIRPRGGVSLYEAAR